MTRKVLDPPTSLTRAQLRTLDNLPDDKFVFPDKTRNAASLSRLEAFGYAESDIQVTKVVTAGSRKKELKARAYRRTPLGRRLAR